MRGGWVDIMTNRPNGTVYTGVTSDIASRANERREGLCKGFTQWYALKHLVSYEFHDEISAAIQREKHEALAASMEGSPDPRRESGLPRFVSRSEQLRAWMAGTSPAMTTKRVLPRL